jgi:hypothetical protein
MIPSASVLVLVLHRTLVSTLQSALLSDRLIFIVANRVMMCSCILIREFACYMHADITVDKQK